MSSKIHPPTYEFYPRANLIYFIILFCIPLSGIDTDLYTPSLPALTNFFNTQKSFVQMTISAFLIGFSLFQLFAGPLVDTLGRRFPLFFALFINAFVAAAIPNLHSIYMVILVRIFQGGAVAVSSVAARSIIIDLYIHNKEIFFKKMSMITIVWGVGPIIAPSIGGYIQFYLNWQVNFYLMSVYALLIGLGVVFFVPETHKANNLFNFKTVLKNYKTILQNKKFLAYSLSCGPMCGCLVLFGITGPFIIQTVLKYTPVVFGNTSLEMGFVWLLGAMICRSGIGHYSDRKFYFVFTLGLSLAAIMIISGLLGYVNLGLVAIPSILIAGVASFIFTNHYTQALAIFPKEIGGSANAMSSSINTAEVVLLTGIGAMVSDQSQVPLGIIYFVTMLFVLVLYYLFLRKGR